MSNWENKKALCTEGGFGCGFWEWFINIDLEDLKSGKGEDAISVYQSHDTAGTSFDVYHGIAREYSLPDGVEVWAVKELIDSIVDRADELTEGFEVYWNGNNHIGRFQFSYEDDDFDHLPSFKAFQFWEELPETLEDLHTVDMVYDLSYSENLNYVLRAMLSIHPLEVLPNDDDELKQFVNEYIENHYGDDESDSETYYINQANAVDELVDLVKEKRIDL